jgi:RNA polymerase sigma-70 factor (ECF subfamily)
MGDQGAFREVVKRFSPRVHAIAYQIIGNSEDAKDVAQDVFLRLHASFRRYDPARPFTTWLYRLTVNQAIDFRRKRIRREHLTKDLLEDGLMPGDRSPQPDKSLERAEFRGAIRRLIRQLSSRQQQIFVLRDLQGFSTREIAEIIRCTESTVRVHLARARKHVREALRTHYPEHVEGGIR